MKRFLGFLTSLAIFVLALTPALTAFSSAESPDWTTDGSGWVVTEDVYGPVYRQTDAGSTGRVLYQKTVSNAFRIAYTLRFNSTDAESSTNYKLRLPGGSDVTETYLFGRIKRSADNKLLIEGQVNYDGAWSDQLFASDWIENAGTEVRIVFEHAQDANTLTIKAFTPAGQELASREVSNEHTTNADFYSKALNFEIGNERGMNTVMNIAVGDDPVADTSAQNWEVPYDWDVRKDANGAIFDQAIAKSSGLRYLPSVGGENGMRIEYTVKADSTAMTSSYLNLALPANPVTHQLFIRIQTLENQLLVLGQRWNQIEGSQGEWLDAFKTDAWVQNAGDTLKVSVERAAGSDTMTFSIAKPDGTVLYTVDFANEAYTGDHFYDNNLMLVIGSDGQGLFEFSDLQIGTPAAPEVPVDGWDYSADVWAATMSGNRPSFALKTLTESQIRYETPVGGENGLKIAYDITVADTSKKTSTTMTLRLPSNPEVKIFARVKTSGNGEFLPEIQLYKQADNSWTTLARPDAWLSTTASAVRVILTRYADSDTLHYALYPVGSSIPLYETEIVNAALTGAAFYDQNLEFYVGSDNESADSKGLFTYSNFSFAQAGSLPTPPATGEVQSDVNAWRLENTDDWTATATDHGVELHATGTHSSFAHYNSAIDGESGFHLSWDVQYGEDNKLSAPNFGLRLTGVSPEKWIFFRVQGSNNGIYVAGQIQHDNRWTDVFSSNGQWIPGTGAADGNGGRVRIELIRAEGSDTMTVRISAINNDGTTGNVLYQYDLTSELATGANFFDNDLYFMIGSDVGQTDFTISNMKGLPELQYKDMKDTAFEKALYLGDSITYGFGASVSWAKLVSDMIAQHQGADITWENKAVSASVLTPLCPAYDQSVKPAANERIATDIGSDPADLIFVAYGVNDLRGGTSLEDFVSEYADYLTEIRDLCGDDAVLVLLNVFGMDPSGYNWNGDWGKGTPEMHGQYNAAIRMLAEEFDALFVDVYSDEASADWLLTDGLHPNDLGQQVIANKVFDVLAANCSILAGTDVPLGGTPAKGLTEKQFTEAVNAMINAESAAEFEAALYNDRLGLDLGFLDTLSVSEREEVMAALALTLSDPDFNLTDPDFIQIALDVLAVLYRVENRNTDLLNDENGINKVVVTGDSISVGWNATDKGSTAWVPTFQKLLENAQGRKVTLINKAISGTLMARDTEHSETHEIYPAAYKRVQTDVIDNDPDLVVIAYGINDVNNNVPLDEFVARYREYLTDIREGTQEDTLIELVGLTYEWNDGRGETIRAFNSAIRALAEEFDAIYADPYSAIQRTEWLLDDGLHPNDAGHRVIADRVFNTLAMHCDLTQVTRLALENIAIVGKSEATTGSTAVYTVTANPEAISLKNYLWTLTRESDTIEVTGDQASFSYKFEKAGTYTLKLTVTDEMNNTKSDQLIITVTDPVGPTGPTSPTGPTDSTQPTGKPSPGTGSGASMIPALAALASASVLAVMSFRRRRT